MPMFFLICCFFNTIVHSACEQNLLLLIWYAFVVIPLGLSQVLFLSYMYLPGSLIITLLSLMYHSHAGSLLMLLIIHRQNISKISYWRPYSSWKFLISKTVLKKTLSSVSFRILQSNFRVKLC